LKHSTRNAFGTFALVIFAVMLSGCAALQPTEQPIPANWHVGEVPSDTLVVFLRGARGRADQFEQVGIIELLAESGLNWDAVTVDAHMGYYRERSVVNRIDQDILEPARAQGYRHIWLSGPSLGGFGSLLFWCQTRHDDIAGIISLAPYLGGRAILNEIEAAGSLEQWQPAGAGAEHEVLIWQCLQGGFPEDLPVWLAWGESDRMARGNLLLARQLPDARVLTSEGGHRWNVWMPLWAQIFEAIASKEPPLPTSP
jgi:hypothetical protein